MGVIRGSSYYQIVEGVNWSSAEANAIALGGNLFSINNESESRWLGNEFSKSKYQYSEDNSAWAPHEWSINHYWSGGIKENGSWKWSNGDSFKTSLSALYLNNSSDQGSDRLLGIFNNPGHTSNIYLDDSRDDYPSNPSNPYKGIVEVPLSYFSISDAEVEEGEKGKIKVTRTSGTSTEQTLILATSDGSAVEGDDYKKKTKTITFAAGETSKTVNIVTNEDIDVESDETIKLTLSASSGDTVPAQIQNGSAILTIKNDEFKRGNSLYTLVDGPSWSEALANAQSLGGSLVTINDSAENQFLVDSFKTLEASPVTSPLKPGIGNWARLYYIGLNDKKVDGNPQWVDGSTSSYRNWGTHGSWYWGGRNIGVISLDNSFAPWMREGKWALNVEGEVATLQALIKSKESPKYP